MITAYNTFLDFVDDNKEQETKLSEELAKLLESRKYLVDRIMKYERELKSYDFPINKLEVISSKIGLAKIKHPMLKTYMVALLGVNREINIKESQYLTVNRKAQVTMEEYRYIVREFNREAVDSILNGYILCLGALGNIFIRNKPNKLVINKEGVVLTKKRIDWGASNKLKAQTLAEGKVVFDYLYNEDGSIKTDEAGNKLDNGGVKTIVYSDNVFDTWVYWEKQKCSMPKTTLYSYKPTAGQGGMIKTLNRMLRNNPAHVRRFLSCQLPKDASRDIIILEHNQSV